MRIASVRDLRQDFGRVLAWVQEGEEVAITMRRKPVARVIAWRKGRVERRPMPDLGARLAKAFGDKVIPDKALRDILDADRGRI